MRLKTKLVLAATGVTFAVVLVLSCVFVGELLRQRIVQTAAANEVIARQVRMMTQNAVETGLREHPPVNTSDETLHTAVAEALRRSDALNATMRGFVRYSPAVQDVSVTDGKGWTLVSTDPQSVDAQAPARLDFSRLRDVGVITQAREVFSQARVLDVLAPLDRNGKPFLVVHVGVRSSFLKDNYIPWIKGALWLTLLAAVLSIAAAGLIVRLAVAPTAARMEQELEVSRRLAAVGRLTAGVGHEVKNPINAMVVHLELLRTKLEEAGRGRAFLEPAMRHVAVLESEMHRLDRVVETLADFTRPMDLRLERLDLSDVAEAVLELTGGDLAEQGVAVDTQLEPAMVWADGDLLRQALLNLLLNGMQAMVDTAEDKRLRIEVHRDRDAGVIAITDRGQGIESDLLPKIFDLYFTTKTTGSGIGLAMSYRIVQMHGGSMEVVSEPGHGATFTVRVPSAPGNRPEPRMLAGRHA